jgi:hypothetical protein
VNVFVDVCLKNLSKKYLQKKLKGSSAILQCTKENKDMQGEVEKTAELLSQ